MQTETNHALQNAKASYENIIEMVRALDIETKAEDYVGNLDLAECKSILDGEEVAYDKEETIDGMRETIQELLIDGLISPDGWDFDEDESRQRIQEDALSVEVRSGWTSLGEELKAEEFMILLTTGGPALRIVGELNEHNEPERAWLEYQDWGTPWTRYFEAEQDTLLTYSRQFYFGE